MRGSYVFDIHPPLGKMTFALFGWLLNYDPTVCDYDDIGTVYDPLHCKYYILRGVSAMFGCAVRARARRVCFLSRETWSPFL